MAVETDIRDTADDLANIVSDIRGILDTTTRLSHLYGTMQSDHMNRALYVLTVVTTVIVPAQVLGTVYGMNFKHMPELEWEYSYLVYWIVVVALAVVIIVLFNQAGYFNLFYATAPSFGRPGSDFSAMDGPLPAFGGGQPRRGATGGGGGSGAGLAIPFGAPPSPPPATRHAPFHQTRAALPVRSDVISAARPPPSLPLSASSGQLQRGAPAPAEPAAPPRHVTREAPT